MATTAPLAPPDADKRLFALMAGVFFAGGLLASVEALLVPRLRVLFRVDYGHALLVQLIYYAGYLVFAWPAGAAMARLGVLRASATGLAIMALGSLALAEAQAARSFGSMLAALLMLSAGVTVLQIACNAVMATHGGGQRAASRFTALQGFNALGTVAGPILAAAPLLGDASGLLSQRLFLGFAGAFAVLAAAFAVDRDLLPAADTAAPTPTRLVRLLRSPRTGGGTAAIFAYVGAEVTIGTLAVSFLMQPSRGHVAAVTAGRLVSLYWAGAMLGRFGGAWAIARVGLARLLTGAAVTAILLTAVAILGSGASASAALLAVGVCNSVMFPAIYSLAMPKRAADQPSAAMLLCMAVVGGAVLPMIAGILADRLSVTGALALTPLCYAGIALFARRIGQTA